MIRGQPITIPVFAYDESGEPTSDVMDAVAYLSKDGQTQVKSTNDLQKVVGTASQGVYLLTLTSEEMDAGIIVVSFQSSQAKIPPITITTHSDSENLKSALQTITALLGRWDMTQTTLTTYDESGAVLKTYGIQRDMTGDIIHIEEVVL